MHRYTLRRGSSIRRRSRRAQGHHRSDRGDPRGLAWTPRQPRLPDDSQPEGAGLEDVESGRRQRVLGGAGRLARRVEVARRKQRPGDILVLAEETPNSLLEFEALRTAAKALLDLKRPLYALSILEKAEKLDPDDVKARQLKGMALGRAERYAEARDVLGSLAQKHQDGETQGLFGRTWKDEWTQTWNAHPERQADPRAAARDTAATLQSAADAYCKAFRAAPAEYYPGINALTLGRLWEHVTDRKSKLPLDAVAAGVGWTVAVAIERSKDYWSLATRAEMALVENRRDEALDDYGEAAALAVANSDRFALDSSRQQLDFLGVLGFRADIVAEAAQIIDRAEKQLDARLGRRPEQIEPKHAVVFSGHMIDNPRDRGPGKAKPARFPPKRSTRWPRKSASGSTSLARERAISACVAAPRVAICCLPRPASNAACAWKCAWRGPNPSF